MRLLAQSSRRFFRRHPGQLALALAGLAAGVAVMTGVALMRDVLLDSLADAGEALTGSETVRVTASHGPLPESLLPELALQPGSPPLVPVLRERVEHERGRLELLGIDPFSLGSGRGGLGPGALAGLLEAPDAVAATPATLERLGVAVGDRLSVTLGDRRLSLEIAGVIGAGRELDDRLVIDIAAAQDLLDRRGELSWIDAPAAAGPWLRERLGDDLTVSTAGQRRESAANLTEGMRANLTAMGLISLAVGLFVIFSVLSFLLVQRRRSLAMLRAVGVTSGRITALLIGETALIAGLGALLGLVLGTVLASQLLGLVRTPAAELYNLLTPAAIEPTAGLYASVWLLAVGMALAAVIVLLREARRIPPGRLLRSPPADTGGMAAPLAASALLVAALAIVFAFPGLPAAFAALFLALGGFALMAPAAGIVVLGWLRRAGPLTLPGRALALLLAGERRIRPAIAALSLALALAAGLAMMVLGFRAAVDDWIDRLLRADSYVTDARGGLSAATIERIDELPGIAETSSARRVDLPDGRELIAYDLPPSAWAGFEWLAGEPSPAFERFRAGEAIVISEPLARRDGLDVGDTVTVPTPGGELSLPVAGIYRDYASERGTIAMHAPLYRQRFDDDERDSLGLYYARTPPREADLRQQLAGIDDDLRLTGRDQVRETTLAVFDRTFRISWALAAMVGVIAVIALVSALLALALERRRDYATLRALGLTPARLHVLVVCQTAGLALASALVAVPLAVVIHLGLSLVIQPRAFGWSLPLSWPVEPLAAMLPLALLCGVLAGLYPAWRIGRRDPAAELRGE